MGGLVAMENVRVAWFFVKAFLKAAATGLAVQFALNHTKFMKFWHEFGIAGILETGAILFFVFVVALLGNLLWCLLLLRLQEKRRREGRLGQTSYDRWRERGSWLSCRLKLSRKLLRV